MERVGSVRAPATVKGPLLAAQKRRRVQQRLVQAPVAPLRVPPRRLGPPRRAPGAWQLSYQNVAKRSFFGRSARSARKLQRTCRAFRRRTRGLWGHGMAWSGNETPRWVCKHRSRPIRALKHLDKRQFDPSTEWLSRFAQCPHGRRVPSEERAGVRGAWHAVLERAVSPGGSTSTVESPYASQNTAQRGILP